MKLRTKLLLAQAPLAAALLIVAAVSFAATRSLDEQARLILRRNYRHGLLVQEMQESLERMDAALTFRSLGRESGADDWDGVRARFEQGLSVHEREGVDASEAAVAG